jgi:hypothetical protein
MGLSCAVRRTIMKSLFSMSRLCLLYLKAGLYPLALRQAGAHARGRVREQKHRVMSSISERRAACGAVCWRLARHRRRDADARGSPVKSGWQLEAAYE